MNEKLIGIYYENSKLPYAGMSAVEPRLAKSLMVASGKQVIIITPYHFKLIPKSISDQMHSVSRLSVSLDAVPISVDVCRHADGSGIVYYFLRPNNKRFFAGERHPYDVSAAQLLEDSLLFGAAVVAALPIIDESLRWSLLLNDWEAATIVLALAGKQVPHKVALLLHNTYDSAVTDIDLRRFGIDGRFCPGETVLQRAIPLVSFISTVSDQFARDVTQDLLQAEIMAPHLQGSLKGVEGNDNGLFVPLNIPPEILIEARRDNFEPLANWKVGERLVFLAALDALVPSQEKQLWGDLSKFKRNAAPWIALAGRDDPRQKGFDIAASAIRKFLSSGGDARFLLFPMPGEEGHEGLNFLKSLADDFPESVLVLPFRFREGFFGALHGATFGLFPSLYGPFESVHEFYLNGAVGIGRATGGIIQQIVPWRAAASFSQAVKTRVADWHTFSAHPTGILYRERDDIQSATADWRGINDAEYDKQGNNPDRVTQREGFALFRAMADELLLAINDGVRLYQNDRTLYYKMLIEGITFLQNTFSWERSAWGILRNLD